MKTYKIEIEQPRLKIQNDDDVESPRCWDYNLGYFISIENNRHSPDRHEQLESIVRMSGDEAQNIQDHIQIMADLINTETSEQVLAIFPITKYEHSGVVYKLGNFSGFDYSNCAFYIITDETFKNSGYVSKSQEVLKGGIESELSSYNDWLNGEVYCFILYDEKGEVVDSCGGFYDVESIRKYLPKDWENEDLSNYIK